MIEKMSKIVKCEGDCMGAYIPDYEVEYLDGKILLLCSCCLKTMCLVSYGLRNEVSSIRRI